MEIYPDEREGQTKYFKTAMADLLIQAVILGELYGLDFAELIELGSQRLDEFRKRGRYQEVE
jgi:hypothetical protein